jgi:hypothetical protein
LFTFFQLFCKLKWCIAKFFNAFNEFPILEYRQKIELCKIEGKTIVHNAVDGRFIQIDFKFIQNIVNYRFNRYKL